MDVFLLCAGYGTRLRPLTNYVPKCLAPIGSIPLLAIWLNQLSKLQFISKVYINCHYMADQVLSFIHSNSFELNIELVVEEKILGTSRSIRNQLSSSTSREFMIIHGDNFSIQDFNAMYSIFKEKTCSNRLTGLALGFRSQDYDTCGFYSYSESTQRITNFIEKPGHPVKGLANGAIFMLTREILMRSLEQSDGIDFCRDNLPSVARYLFLYEATVSHIDIGSHSALSAAQKHSKHFQKIPLNSKWHKQYSYIISTFLLSQ